MAFIEFPEGKSLDALNRLVTLHPGMTRTDVIIRAMTCYHCLYEMYLEDKVDDQVRLVMEFLDEKGGPNGKADKPDIT
jgi:hypothetical protein